MAAITLGAALSCEKEMDVTEDVSVRPVTDGVAWSFTADVEEALTKMGDMDGSGNFAWANGDEVKVLYDGGSTTATASVSEGKTTFEPVIPEGIETIWLVYPSSMTASLDGDNLVVDMPAVQKNALKGYFVAKANFGDESVSFKHPVCYYKFVVDGDGVDVTRLTLTSAASNNLTAASLSLSFDASGEPSVTPVSAAATLTVDFSGAGTYYVPVLPGVSPEAGDLTFQFYRGEAKTEKAGAFRYSKEIDNNRADILNWGSLPAKATNRYVSTTGSIDNNGATAEAPWNFDKFQAFIENNTKNGNTARDAAAIALYDGINIRFAGGEFTINSKVTTYYNLNGITSGIKINMLGADDGTTVFKGESSGVILWDIYRVAGDSYYFKNITFKDGKNESSEAGCFRLGSRAHTVSFEDCTFNNNSATTSGKNGGAFYVSNATTLSFKNCTMTNNSANGYGGFMSITNTSTAYFEGCTFTKNHGTFGGVFDVVSGSEATITCVDCTFGDGTEDGKNYATTGGGVLIGRNTKVQSFTDCVFNYNTAGGNWTSCIYLYGTKGRLNINRCLFKNNIGLNRGVIGANVTSSAVADAHLIYLNASSFYNNTMTGADGYGSVIQGNYGTTVCMNNVTTNNNYCSNASPSNNNWTLNLDGSWLIVNSTFIDKGRQHVLRANLNDTSVDISLCNSIVIQYDGSQNYPLWFRNVGTITNGGHNLRGSSSNQGNTPANSTDMFSITANSLGGSWSEVWNDTDKYGVYTWTNSLSNFTPATKEEVENTIKNYDHEAAGVTIGGTGEGSFYAWLEGIGALGKDGRGVTRTGSWWPGAYQN